jgi:hypothetical protein
LQTKTYDQRKYADIEDMTQPKNEIANRNHLTDADKLTETLPKETEPILRA